MIVMEQTLHCSCCNEDWPADTDFYFAASDRRSGLSHHCKACYREHFAAPARKITPDSRKPYVSDVIAPLLGGITFFGQGLQ